jgi:formiminotetrahydrofolate cyclodeaminase
MTAIKDTTTEQFLTELASRAATPGGGSAAAVMGAMGAALTAMVCHLTIGKKKYATVEAELRGVLDRADALRARLVYAIEEDVGAFNAVMAAYGLPKETPDQQRDRHAAIQSALREATDAPLACARLCHEVIELAAIVSEKGNSAVISDGGVAALAAHAALRSAALNVYVNAKAIEDRAFAEDRLLQLGAMLDAAAALAEATYKGVASALR